MRGAIRPHEKAAGEPSGAEVVTEEAGAPIVRAHKAGHLRHGGNGHPQNPAHRIHLHAQGRPQTVSTLRHELAHPSGPADPDDLPMVHAPDIEGLLPWVIGDSLGEQIGLRQGKSDRTPHQRRLIPRESLAHLLESRCAVERREIGVGLHVAGERVGAGQGVDHPAVRGTEALGLLGAGEECRVVVGLIGANRVLVRPPRIEDRVGLRGGMEGREEGKRCERGFERHGTPNVERGEELSSVIPRSGATRDRARRRSNSGGEDPSLRSG